MNRTSTTLSTKAPKTFVSIIVLLVLRLVTQNEELFFVGSIILFTGLILRGAKLHLPTVFGFGLFNLIVIIAAVGGLYAYSTRDVFRDLFYIVPSLLWIVIGYLLATNRDLHAGRSMLKTLYLYGALVSLACYARFIVDGDSSFNGIRQVFVSYVYDAGLLIPVVVYLLFVEKDYQFSKRIDTVILALMVSQVVLSLGRISVGAPIIGLLALFVLLIFDEGLGGRATRVLFVLALILAAGLLALVLLPQDAVLVLMSKLDRSLSEVSTSTEIASVETAMNSWRSYEIQAVWLQWRESSLGVQLFGSFLGTGISIDYVPYNWETMVVDRQIPLLHNGFLTLLPKVGIAGVCVFLAIYVGAVSRGIRLINRGGMFRKIGHIVMPIMLMTFLLTYVVRGPVSETCFFVWAVLLGWLFGRADRLEACSSEAANGPPERFTERFGSEK